MPAKAKRREASSLNQPGLFGNDQPGLLFPSSAAVVAPDLVQPTPGGQAQVSAPLLYFYRRWYEKRPRNKWPVSDRHVGGEDWPVTCLSMFAALNFAIAACMATRFEESVDHLKALGVQTARNGDTLIAYPEEVFAVALRWVMQCMVTRTRCPYQGGQELHGGFHVAVSQGNYKLGGNIDAVLPAEWLTLFLPHGFGMLQEAVDDAFHSDWWHARLGRPPEGTTNADWEWIDPIGHYYSTRVIR